MAKWISLLIHWLLLGFWLIISLLSLLKCFASDALLLMLVSLKGLKIYFCLMPGLVMALIGSLLSILVVSIKIFISNYIILMFFVYLQFSLQSQSGNNYCLFQHCLIDIQFLVIHESWQSSSLNWIIIEAIIHDPF